MRSGKSGISQSASTPMRIAVLSSDYREVGGREKFVFEVTERLSSRHGCEAHVFAARWQAERSSVTFHKVPVIPFPRWFKPISFAWFADRLSKTGSYDIIHSHDRNFTQDILTHHGLPHRTWVTQIRKKRASLFDRATAWVEEKGITHPGSPWILPVSDLSRSELKKSFQIPESRMRVIHPGISTKRFFTMDREPCRAQILRSHGFEKSDLILLFVGMNFEVKGLDRVLEGISVFTEGGTKNTRLKLLVVGKGDEKAYSKMASDLRIGDQVFFAGVSREVEKYFVASDLFILPSRLDTFGMVVLEAMAAGLPVIIAGTVGARDIVSPDKNGFILSEKNLIADMTSSLEKLMNEEFRSVMGKNAKKEAALHDWDMVSDRVMDVYRMRLQQKQGNGLVGMI